MYLKEGGGGSKGDDNIERNDKTKKLKSKIINIKKQNIN